MTVLFAMLGYMYTVQMAVMSMKRDLFMGNGMVGEPIAQGRRIALKNNYLK